MGFMPAAAHLLALACFVFGLWMSAIALVDGGRLLAGSRPVTWKCVAFEACLAASALIVLVLLAWGGRS